MTESMDKPDVPVTMGSAGAATMETSRIRCTQAFFAGNSHLHAHRHDRPTFAVMLEGGFELQFTSPGIRDRRLSCPTGTIFTEPAGEQHANTLYETGARVLVVQPDLSAEMFKPVRAMLSDRINHFRHGRIQADARRLAREIQEPDSLSHLAMEALALDMLAEAARIEAPDADVAGVSPWFRKAEEYIHEQFRAAPRIRDVAEVAGVHPAHLASVFRRVYDVPLGTYMRRLRVEWVADRLVATDEEISTLAYRAGFADQSHLTRTFKRATGWTPGAYRRASRRTTSGE